MQKIGTFIESIDSLLSVNKVAFIPASAINGGRSPGGPQGQGSSDPSQGQQPQGGGDPSQGGGQAQQMMQQIQQMLQQAPPEVQQQAQQALQQVQGLPPQQQEQALKQIGAGLSQMMQQGGGSPQGDPAAQGQGAPPQQGQGDPAAQGQQAAGQVATDKAVRAENELDSKTVTLTVRELMDLTTGGNATKSLLAVKQIAEQHNQKMNQAQAKVQQQAQQAKAEQQMAAQQGAQGGGLYPVAPDTSGKMSQPQQQ